MRAITSAAMTSRTARHRWRMSWPHPGHPVDARVGGGACLPQHRGSTSGIEWVITAGLTALKCAPPECVPQTITKLCIPISPNISANNSTQREAEEDAHEPTEPMVDPARPRARESQADTRTERTCLGFYASGIADAGAKRVAT